jgi:hypothetical protein
MTKCETRKQLSYSRLGTGISQENANISGVMSYRCSFRDIQRSKRPNTINFLFQILLFYFEELKKTNSNITGRTVSALLTEELLEKNNACKN